MDSEFAWAAQYIRTLGTPEKFFAETYIYLYLDGLKYWTMQETIGEPDIINRAAANDFRGDNQHLKNDETT